MQCLLTVWTTKSVIFGFSCSQFFSSSCCLSSYHKLFTEFWFTLIMIVWEKRSQVHVTLLLVQTVHLTKFICKYVHGFLSLLRQTFTVDYGVALHFYFLPHPNPRINVINPDWASAIKHPPVPPSKNMAWWYMLRGVYSFLIQGGWHYWEWHNLPPWFE